MSSLFDVGSPTAYLAWTQLPGLAKRTGAEIKLTPILLGGLFNGSGNHSPAVVPAKRSYIAADCARFAERFGVPFHQNPHFPVNTLMAMRAIAGADLEGAMDVVAAAAFEAMWIDGVNLGDPTELETFANKSGIGIDAIAGVDHQRHREGPSSREHRQRRPARRIRRTNLLRQ